MNTVGIINSDPEVESAIQTAFDADTQHSWEVKFLSSREKVFDFFYYDFPELVVINFSDSMIDVDEIVTFFQNDKLILNFGLVGLFSYEYGKEEALLVKYKDINLLTLLETYRIRTQLVKTLQIIAENYQIIFQQGGGKNFLPLCSGVFSLQNDLVAVPLYVGIVATIIAERGEINPERKMHLQLALSELVVNGIEHGNCAITYDEKTVALDAGMSMNDLITERCKDPIINAKRVLLAWDIKDGYSEFIIQDEGMGFDVKGFRDKVAQQDAMMLHGRGIVIARKLFDKLSYNTKGNRVTLMLRHDAMKERGIPIGFANEKVLEVNEGDIVLAENDNDDYLYYIVSGVYTISHNNVKVGELSPQDIFMGEMAFLLKQKRTATVSAKTPGKLIRFTRKRFISIIREYPHYGVFLARLLAQRLVRTNERQSQNN